MSPERGAAVTPRRRRWLAPVVAAAVIAIDQVTKTWALHLPSATINGQPILGRHLFGTVYLELTFNSGAAFGLGSGVTPIVEAVVVVLVGALLVAGRRAARPGAASSLALGLVIGGAVGNLSDRLFRNNGGAVIDFLDVAQVNGHEYWPVFNVADSCIVVGAILLAVQYSRSPARATRSSLTAPDHRPDA